MTKDKPSIYTRVSIKDSKYKKQLNPNKLYIYKYQKYRRIIITAYSIQLSIFLVLFFTYIYLIHNLGKLIILFIGVLKSILSRAMLSLLIDSGQNASINIFRKPLIAIGLVIFKRGISTIANCVKERTAYIPYLI